MLFVSRLKLHPWSCLLSLARWLFVKASCGCSRLCNLLGCVPTTKPWSGWLGCESFLEMWLGSGIFGGSVSLCCLWFIYCCRLSCCIFTLCVSQTRSKFATSWQYSSTWPVVLSCCLCWFLCGGQACLWGRSCWLWRLWSARSDQCCASSFLSCHGAELLRFVLRT